MHPDQRIRTGLERNAASFTPDVFVALERVQRRRRRTNALRPMVGIAAAFVAIVAFWAVAQRSPESSSSPPPTVPTTRGMAGESRTFEAAVTRAPSDTGLDLTGRWRIEFSADGTVSVEPPDGFEYAVSAPAATVTDHELTTDLFSADLCAGRPSGRYHWSIAPWGDLNLAPIEETCRERAELLTGPGWTWKQSPLTPPTSGAPRTPDG